MICQSDHRLGGNCFILQRAADQSQHSKWLEKCRFLERLEELNSNARVAGLESGFDFVPDTIQKASALIWISVRNPPVQLAEISQDVREIRRLKGLEMKSEYPVLSPAPLGTPLPEESPKGGRARSV